MATEHTHYTWDDRSKRSWGKEREGKEVDLGLLLRDIRVVCSQGQIQPWYCSLCSLLTVQFAHCTFPWHFCSLWHFHDTFAHCDISMTLLLTVHFPRKVDFMVLFFSFEGLFRFSSFSRPSFGRRFTDTRNSKNHWNARLLHLFEISKSGDFYNPGFAFFFK